MRKKEWSKQEVIKKKLDKISAIWTGYIRKYRFCQGRIKYTPDVKSNYFGDITGYFSDTLPILFKKNRKVTFASYLESAISFLQIIYVQQDLVEELLHIFKCKSTKAVLNKDGNYKTNRELRNELVGHPVRKKDIEGSRELLSSTLFSDPITAEEIAYLRYHRDNKYKFEAITHKKTDILERHTGFLLTYLDKIIGKQKVILLAFKKEIAKLETVLEKGKLEAVVHYTGICFEYIFRYDNLYQKDFLLGTYKLKDTHPRYQHGINLFLDELRQVITDTKRTIEELVTDDDRFSQPRARYKTPRLRFTYVDDPTAQTPEPKEQSFSCEMGKLGSKDDTKRWTFYMSLLRKKVAGNDTVLRELQHMEDNFENDMEYYCAYHYAEILLSID